MPGSAVRMYSSTFTKPRSTLIFVFSMPTFSVRGRAADRHQHLLGFQLLLLAIDGEGDRDAVFVFSTFSTLAFTKPLMPRLRYTRISSFETSSSSTGT